MDPLVLSVLGNAWVKELSSRREASCKFAQNVLQLFVARRVEVKCLDVFLCVLPCVCVCVCVCVCACGQGRGGVSCVGKKIALFIP